MGRSVNKVILVGRVGSDPERKGSQKPFYSFSLATSDTWNDRMSGERRERTEWHKVVVFSDRLTNVIERYVRKGTQLYIEGCLRTRKWDDNSGQSHYTTEVVLENFRSELVLLSGRSEGEQDDNDNAGNGYGAENRAAPRGNAYPSGRAAAPASNGQGSLTGGWDVGGNSELDDEIPF